MTVVIPKNGLMLINESSELTTTNEPYPRYPYIDDKRANMEARIDTPLILKRNVAHNNTKMKKY